MISRLIDTSPLTGVSTIYHYDPATGQHHYEDRQEVAPLLDMNRRRHNDATDKSWKGDMHHVASLPLIIWFKLKKAGILNDPKAFRKWLNDPDNAQFRTRPGRV